MVATSGIAASAVASRPRRFTASVNGVPARRVNAAYVIATSARVPVAGVSTDAFTDAFFAKPKKDRSKSVDAAAFFGKQEAAAKVLPEAYTAAQAALDKALTAAMGEELKGYLQSRFSLRSGDKPHAMAF